MISAPELASIYEDLRGTLEHYAMSLGADQPTAEDIVHDAMLRFWRRYKRGRKPLNLAVSIVRHLIYNSTRDRRVRTNLLMATSTHEVQMAPDEAMELEETRAETRRVMLTGLKGPAYTTVRLYLDGHSPKDIAEQTGRSVGHIYHLLRTA